MSVCERERRGGRKIEREQDMGGEQDLRRGLRVRYVRASDVRRGSVERRERKSNEVGDGFDPDGFTPIHAFW